MRPKSTVSAVLFLVPGAAGLALRVYLVRQGILYGAARVTLVDTIAASLVAIGVAAISFFLVRRPAGQSGTFADRAATLTALVGVAALVASGVNLLVPMERAGVSVAACSGAHTLASDYVGVTTGPEGNNSRSGPARYYPANGRFPSGCALGFSAAACQANQ